MEKISDTINNPLRVARLQLALHDILLSTLGIMLAKLFFRLILGKDDKEAEKQGKGRTADENLLIAMSNDLEYAVIKAFGEFDPFQNTLGNLRVTPGFVDFWKKIPGDLTALLSGDKDVETTSRRYIKAMSLVPKIE